MVLTWGHLPLWASILASGATAGLLASLVGYPVLRVRGPYFVILTFGVAEFVKHIVINAEAALGKFGRLIIGAPDIGLIFQMMLGLAVVASLLAFYVRRSRFGAGLRAIREDETAAQTTGVPVVRFKVIAFSLSALIPGMAGALVILRSGYFEPLQAFNPLVSLTIIAMAVIGGSDDAPGPLFGALFLVVLSELLWATAPQVYMMLLGLLLIVFVMAAPDGLYGRLRQLLSGRGG
jgi:branched-chain amino acid transport system permease protein